MSTFLYPPISVSLAGGATELKQDDIIAELVDLNVDTAAISVDTAAISVDTDVIAGDTTSIDAKTPALGAAATAASVPVNIASDQVVPVSATALPLPTGASTSALQTSGNASLTSIDGKVVACNTGAVVIASGNVTTNALTPKDFLDSGLLNTASTNIPAAGVSVVASLASDVKELEVVEDIGEFMVITNAADAVLAYLPLGGGRVKVSIASGTELKLASVSGSTISLGKIAINFLG